MACGNVEKFGVVELRNDVGPRAGGIESGPRSLRAKNARFSRIPLDVECEARNRVACHRHFLVNVWQLRPVHAGVMSLRQPA